MWALGSMAWAVMAVDQPTHPRLHAALNGYQLEQHKKYFATSFPPRRQPSTACICRI